MVQRRQKGVSGGRGEGGAGEMLEQLIPSSVKI